MDTALQCARAMNGRQHVACLLLIVACAAPLRSQAAPQRSQDEPIPAGMLRVLAEAADGFRTGQAVFFVADRRYPYNIAGTFESRPAAEAARADSGSSYGVFGPYTTPADRIADTSPRVIGVRLTLQTARGRVFRELDPTKVDAVFLTPSAVDKFLLPYYTSIYGPKYSADLWSIVLREGLKPICHGFSRPCDEEGGIITVHRPADRPR